MKVFCLLIFIWVLVTPNSCGTENEVVASRAKRSVFDNIGNIFSSLFGGKKKEQNNFVTTTKSFDIAGLFNNILSMKGLQETEDAISNIHEEIIPTVKNLGKDMLGFIHESANEIMMFFEKVKGSKDDFKNLMYVFGMFRTFSYMVPHEFNLRIDLKNYKTKLYERFEKIIETIEEAALVDNSTQYDLYVFWDLIQPEFRTYMLKTVSFDLNNAVNNNQNQTLNWANIPDEVKNKLNSSFAKKINQLEKDECPTAKKIGKLLEKVSLSMKVSIDKIKSNYSNKMNQNLLNLANKLTNYELNKNYFDSSTNSKPKYQNYFENDESISF